MTDWALPSGKLVKGAKLKIVPGGPHGMCSTLKDQINADCSPSFTRQSGRRSVEKVHMTANTALLVIRPPLVSDLWPRSLMTGNSSLIGLRKGSEVDCFLLLSDVGVRPGVFC